MRQGKYGNIELTEEELVPLRDSVPMHLHCAIIGYIEQGQPVGHFLTALLGNQLVETIKRADGVNILQLREIVDWFIGYAPAPCWGSPEKVALWLEKAELRAYRANVDLVKEAMRDSPA